MRKKAKIFVQKPKTDGLRRFWLRYACLPPRGSAKRVNSFWPRSAASVGTKMSPFFNGLFHLIFDAFLHVGKVFFERITTVAVYFLLDVWQ